MMNYLNKILETYQVKTSKKREKSLKKIDLKKLKTLSHQKPTNF